MKPAKLSYLIMAIGIFILTLSPILGSSLSVKLTDSNGLHKTNKISAVPMGESTHKDNDRLTQENLRQLTQYSLKEYDLAYAFVSAASASYKKKQSSVWVLGVNDRYFQFQQINLKRGSFLTSDLENLQVAVIDEDLARELFQNLDVIGLEIELYGQKFKIIGVAANDPSLIGTLTDMQYGIVYIPAEKLLELEANPEINYLEVETKDAGITGLNTANLQTALASIGKNSANYRIIDYNLEYFLFEQKSMIRDFVIGIAVLAILFSLFKESMRDFYHFFRLRLRGKYFTEIIKEESRWLILSIAKMSVIIAAMFLLWKIISFPLYIPPENIPNELTDLSFFADLLKNAIQTKLHNTSCLSPGELRLNLINTIQNWNLLLNIFLGIPLIYLGLYLIKQSGRKLWEVELFCCACIITALFTGIGLLLTTKMPLATGTREVVLVFVFIFLSVFRGFRETYLRKSAPK